MNARPFARAALGGAVAAAVAAGLGAQAQQSGSPAMVIAQGLSLDANTNPGQGSTPLFTGSEFSPAPPSLWGGAPGPDFGQLPFVGLNGVEIDAISTGLDLILSNDQGVVTVPPLSWGMINLSVDPATQGDPASPNLAIWREANPPGNGAADDLFGYTLPGGLMPTNLAERTFRSRDGTEMGLAPGSNVDAHDVYVGLLYRENPQIQVPLFQPEFLFSVTAETAASGVIPASWWGGPPNNAPSGATILMTVWDDASNAWSVPFPFLNYADLGLQADDDVDALAVERVIPDVWEVLFSTTPVPGRDQILYVSSQNPGTNFVYRLPGSDPGLEPVSQSIGLLVVDNINAICTLDPGRALPGTRYLSRIMGYATTFTPALKTPQLLGASIFRRATPTGEELITWMTGWPPPGTQPPPGAQTASALFVSFSGTAFGSWLTLPGNVQSPRPCACPTRCCQPWMGFPGHPEQFAIPLPPGLPQIDVFFVWGAVDLQTGAFNVSKPLAITL